MEHTTAMWRELRAASVTDAASVLFHYRLARPHASRVPVNVYDLARWLGVRVVEIPREDKDQPDWSGALVPTKDPPVVWTREQDHRYHRRFTVAHEIGHLLLHADATTVFRDVTYQATGPVGVREREANEFAAQLLMPASEVEIATATHGFDLPKLAKMFDVSVAAMQYRLVRLGYLR